MTEIDVFDATKGRWNDLDELFGASGASHGCWCQYWLIGRSEYRRRGADANQQSLRTQIAAGHAGLIAYRRGRAVGWARLTPRSELTWVQHHYRHTSLRSEDAWAMPCFFVAHGERGNGVMRALIRAGAGRAQARGVELEGYPIDTSVPGATKDRFAGVLRAFMDEGFVKVGRMSKDRVRVVRPVADSTVVET